MVEGYKFDTPVHISCEWQEKSILGELVAAQGIYGFDVPGFLFC